MNSALGFCLVLLAHLVASTKATEYRQCTQSDCSGRLACATIYQHNNFRGWYQCLNFQGNNDCITLNQWWIGSGSRVSSINTYNTCIRLHEDRNCRGYSVVVRPGSAGHRKLSSVKFDNEAKSVSSCNRPGNYEKCQIKTLFSRMVPIRNVTMATSTVLQVVDQVAPRVLSAVGTALGVPFLDTIYNAVRWIINLFSPRMSMEALIQAKIEKAAARNSANLVWARIHAIGNRLESLFQNRTRPENRIADLTVAINDCEAVKVLFEGQDYSFSRMKVVSSPFLNAFSTLYILLAKMEYAMRPERQAVVTRQMREMVTLNENFRRDAIRQRREMFTWARWRPGYVIHDKLVCPNDFNRRRSGCRQYPRCYYWHQCTRCQSHINATIEREITAFFQPILTALRRFPN